MLIISAVLLTCFLLFGVCGIGVQGVFRLVLGVLLGIAIFDLRRLCRMVCLRLPILFL